MTTDLKPGGRPLLGALALWLLPLLALHESARAAFGGWRPEGNIEHGLLLLFALWLAGGAFLFARTIRRRVGRLWRELLLLAAVSVFCWATLEVGAHLADRALRPEFPFHTRGPNLHLTHQINAADIPGIPGPSQFSTGPDGVRAAAPPTPEQHRRVLCIGGSTTECVYLDDRKTWPAQLEEAAARLLGRDDLWVGNVGISGYDTRDHLTFLRESPLARNVDLLVVQPGINDLWRFLAGEEGHTNFARFAPPAEDLASAPAEAAPPAPPRPLWTRSRVIQLVHTLRAEAPETAMQEGIGGLEYQIRRERRAAASLTDTLPDLAPGLDGYRARLRAIIDACAARGIPVLFITQPVLWREDLPESAAALCWFGWLEDGRYLTLGALREAIDRYNAALLETCREAGVPCVDLSPMNGNPAHFYDDCHFTEAGAKEVAERVAPALAALLPE